MAGAQRLRPSGFKKADSNRPDRPASGTGLSGLRMEAVTLSFRPLRVIVGLDYKAADAWLIEF